MPITVDEKPIEQLSGHLALALRDVLEQMIHEGRYVETVTINHRAVTVDSLSRSDFQCKDEDDVKITTCTLDQLVNNTMESSFEVTPKLYDAVEKSIQEFRSGNDEEGVQLLSSFIDSLQWHVDVLGNLVKLHPGPSAVHELNDALQSIIPMLHQAWDGHDYVLLADVMEYELLQWLERWYATANLFRSQMKLESMKPNNIQ